MTVGIDPYHGKIEISYNVTCLHCDYGDVIQGTTRKRFINHLIRTGWRKENKGWICEDCNHALNIVKEVLPNILSGKTKTFPIETLWDDLESQD